MAPKRYARADRKKCVSCGACTHECPREAITIWKGCFAVIDKDRCIGCGKCAKTCPANSIELLMREAAVSTTTHLKVRGLRLPCSSLQ